MIQRKATPNATMRIHSSLEPENYRRLQVLAEREDRSISTVVRMAIVAYLDRREPRKGKSD
jgi:predicted transcriptional regulator